MEQKQRLLSKIDEFNKYFEELEAIKPATFEEYIESVEKKEPANDCFKY